MDFSDTLYVAPAAPRTDAPAPANAAPAAGSGEKSEFASKLAETNRSDANRTETKSEAKADARPADGNSEAPATGTPAKDSADASGAANTAAQGAAAPVQAASQPIRVTPAAILLQLNAVQPEGAADNNTFNPTFPVGIDPATQQLTAHSGAAPSPQSTTLPIPAAKKGDDGGATIQNPVNALDTLANGTAAAPQTAPAPTTTAAPVAVATVVAAPVIATPAAASQPTQLAAAAPVAATAAATSAPVATPAPAKAAAPATDAKSAATEKDATISLTSEPSDKTSTDAAPSTGAAKTASQPTTQASQSSSTQANAQSNAQSGAQASAQTNAQVAVTLDAATQAAQAAPSPDAVSAPIVQIADASLTTSASSSSSSSSATATPAALQDAPAAVAQVYTRFIERNDGRAQRFEVRLDPAELGRVDVRIEVGADHKVHAVLAAHDSAALSDLMRGQRSLERALGDAGVDLADNGLSFELASDSRSGFAGQQGSDAQSGADLAHAWRGFDTAAVPVDVDANVMAAASRPWRTSRLDLVA